MSGSRYRRLGVAAAGVILLQLAGGAPAYGQTTTNTSGIEGRAVDEKGGVLPAVTVTVRSPALQAPQLETVTDRLGRYRFTSLPGGIYKVTFNLDGFRMYSREALQVDAGFVATVDARLEIGQFEESVVVSGTSPVVDVRTTAPVSNVKREVLDSLPTGRGYEDMGKLAPGVRVDGVPDVGGNKTGGGRGSLVNYGSSEGGSTLMFEGVNTDATAGYYDMGAMDEMVVTGAGNDPEIATPGMTFQFIMKSGGNNFHGEAFAAIQTRGMQGDNVDDRLRGLGVRGGNPMDGYHDLNASLGGRILRDKLWFFASLRRKEYRQELIGFSGASGPDGVYYTGDDEQGITTDRESNLSGKVTFRANKQHTLSYMRHYNFKKQDNRAGGTFVSHEAAQDYELPNTVHKGEWTFTPTNGSILQASIGQSYWKSRSVPYTDIAPGIDVETGHLFGAAVNSVGADSTPAGSFSSRWQYNATYTHFVPQWLGADHEFKVGAYFTREWYNKFQEARGEGTGGVGHDYRRYLDAGEPIEILLYNSPFVSKNNVNYQSAFFRDTLRLGARLTVNVGLRFERYHVFLPEQSKPGGPFSEAANFDRSELYDWKGLAPRFGLSYAITGDNRTVLKATYGRFNWALRAGDSRTIRNFNYNDYSATRYRWNDLNGNGDFEYPGELGDFLLTEGAKSNVYNEIDQPKTQEFTIHVVRELANNLGLRVGYVYKAEKDLFQFVNTARPYEVYNIPITTVDPGPDGRVGTGDDGGRVTYYDFDPAYRGRAFESNSYVNVPGYDNSYNNIEIGLDKRFSRRWRLMATYLATKRNVWRIGVPTTPNEETFPKDETWQTTFRASGAVNPGWGLQLSGLFEYQSGAPTARDVRFTTGLRQLSNVVLLMEPLGSQRLPAVKLLNVRVSKDIKIAGGKIQLQADLYNALNSNDETGQTLRSGSSYGRITAILPPRVARLGVRYSF